MREKAERLRKHGLGWWLEVLLPVLDQFVAAAHGRAAPAFWNSLCNISGGSGDPGSPLTGWIQVRTPPTYGKYVNQGKRCGHCSRVSHSPPPPSLPGRGHRNNKP